MNIEKQRAIQEFMKQARQLANQAQQLRTQNSINKFLSFIIWCASSITGILFLFYVPESLTKNLILSVIWIGTLIQSMIVFSSFRLLEISLIKERAFSALVKYSLEKMKEYEAIVQTTCKEEKEQQEEKEERII